MKVEVMTQGYGPIPVGITYKTDGYTNKKLTVEELFRLGEVVLCSDNFVLHPINTNMGFSIGFKVSDTNKREPAPVLMFLESQLPAGYDFKALSLYFMQPRNLERAKRAGIEILNNRGHYDY